MGGGSCRISARWPISNANSMLAVNVTQPVHPNAFTQAACLLRSCRESKRPDEGFPTMQRLGPPTAVGTRGKRASCISMLSRAVDHQGGLARNDSGRGMKHALTVY